jgi:hypothetical protein
MFSKAFIVFVTVASSGLACERWLERNDKAVLFHPRRFGQPPRVWAPGLRQPAITPLLAAQGECSQQNFADPIIGKARRGSVFRRQHTHRRVDHLLSDAAQQFDGATKANVTALAVEYRQVENSTPPDFAIQPNISRNSVFCQKAPKNVQLNGLVQAQDPREQSQRVRSAPRR